MTDPNAVEADGEDNQQDGDGADNLKDTDLPREVVDEVERLTRLERTAVDENEVEAYETRSEELLDEHDFTSRIRDDDGDDVLVLHPEEWHEDGVIRTDCIEDIDRAVEILLEGTGDPDDWESVDEHNRDLVAAVREDHGDVHGDNAAMLADFAGNHYAKPIESLTSDELAEFRREYVVRNTWPTEKQQNVLEDSIELILETAGSVPDSER
ncbi:rnhA operon protein [Natrinema zhouii]|uniref:RnhA operon protein n=1 Tax=Natrinema zhouii TaxID=1710539 RepID=A0A7D6CNX0_9EURY|nr:rnhA operon protein [Natrinema zhouii]QLK26277.1 rnhA operon protein [Natrinema zhouii]